MHNNFSIEDITKQDIKVTNSSGLDIQLPWVNSTSGPLVTITELYSLAGLRGKHATDPLIQYTEVATRLNKLNDYYENGYTITIGGDAYSKNTDTPQYNIRSKIDSMYTSYNELFDNVVNVKPGQQGLLRLMTPQAQRPRSDSLVPSYLNQVIDTEIEAENSALRLLGGPQDISLQIGYITFGPDELGPECIVIGDINSVSSFGSLRSDTDVTIKLPGGRAYINVDITFQNTDVINDKVRSLLGMIKIAPIIPIGGKLLNAALINQITAKDTFNELKNKYASLIKSGRKDKDQAIEEAIALGGPTTKVTLDQLTEIIGSQREALSIIRRSADEEINRQNAARDSKTRLDDGVQVPDATELINANNTIPITLAVVADSITVSTIGGAPGAVKLRLTLQKMSNSYLPPGGLTFVDDKGNPTFDIRKSILEDSVKSVFLNRDRMSPQFDGTSSRDPNKFYIPKIGEDTNIADLDKSRFSMTKSDVGHTLYKPIYGGAFSPILFRFSTPKNPDILYEYIPDDMILTSVQWTYANKLAAIPLDGHLYPTFQHMGMGAVVGSLSFVTNSIDAVRKFSTIKSAIDQNATCETSSGLFRREFVDIYNDILNLSGVKRFIFSQVTTTTDADNTDLYHISIEISSNSESVRQRETIQYQQGTKTRLGDAKAFWWWLYTGVVIKFLQGIAISDRANASRIFGISAGAANSLDFTQTYKDILLSQGLGDISKYTSPIDFKSDAVTEASIYGRIGTGGVNTSHTQGEIDLIKSTVFGKIANDGSIIEGILERNIVRAAIIEVLRSGSAGTGLDYGDIKDDYSNSKDLQKGEFKDFLSYAANASLTLGADPSSFGGPDFLLNKNTTQNSAAGIRQIFDAIIKRYNNKSSLATSWFITMPEYQDKIEIWLEAFKDAFDGEPAKERMSDPILSKFIKDDAVSTTKLPWIPTPTMWDKVYYVINNATSSGLLNQRGVTVDDKPGGYLLSRTGRIFGEIDYPAFFLSDNMANMSAQLGALVSDPVNQSLFPSFWKKKKRTEEAANVGSISLLGSYDSSTKPYSVDPSVYENRNNYIDLPLPRYAEVFADKDGRPVTDSGYEVWRKIAPTYLELGIKPDLFDSLSGIVIRPQTDHNPAQISVKYPVLLTPRAFLDYMDPGFFYFKKSWLMDKYNEIITGIEDGTKDGGTGELHPLGDNPASGYGLSPRERQRIKEFNDNPDLLEPIKLNFSREELIEKREAVTSAGVITTGKTKELGGGDDRDFSGPWAADRGDVGRFFARQTAKDLNAKVKNNPVSSTVPVDVTRIALLSQGLVKRIPVLDNTGVAIGMIVAGSQKGYSGGNLYKLNVNFSIEAERQKLGEKKVDGNKDFYFVYIDSTPIHPKHPLGITYQDSAGVLKYNTYDAKGASSIFRETIHHATDLKANHLRAYPTFRLFFVKEKLVGDSFVQYLEDDMYGYSSVISIELSLDKEDAATAVIQLTDISGVLSTSQFLNDTLSSDDKGVVGDAPFYDSTDGFNSTKLNLRDVPNKIKLEPGTNIVLKMGYGHDPDTLQTVFTGCIAEVSPGQITTIVAQSYKTELFKQVNFYSSVDFFGGLLDRYILGRNTTSTVSAGEATSTLISPNYIILKILSRLAEVPGVSEIDKFSGIPHFGRFMTLATYRTQGRNAKVDLTNKWMSDRDSGSSALPSVLDYINKYNENYLHTNAMRNVFWGEDAGDSFFDSLTSEWLVNSDGWNALKEITRYKVGYICQEVPYGTKATLFIGKPDQLYHYKPVPYSVLRSYSAALPIIQNAIFADTFYKILDKYFRSDEFGIDQNKYAWIDYLIRHNKTLLSYQSLEDSTKLFADLIIDKVNSLISYDGSGSFVLTDDIEEFRDISLLPSFTMVRYLLNRIKTSTKALGIHQKPATSNEVRSISSSKVFNSSIGNFYDPNAVDTIKEIPFLGDENSGIITFLNYPIPDEIPKNGLITTDEQRALFDSNITALTSGVINNRNRIVVDEVFGLGYSPGDYVAVTLGGSIVSKSELMSRFRINPRTRTPNEFIGTKNKVSPGDIVVASELSFVNNPQRTSDPFDHSPATKPAYIVSREGEIAALNASNVPITSLLLDDRSSDLETITSYSSDLLKLAFSLFFGISATEEADEGSGAKVTRTRLSFPSGLESCWLDYTKAVMNGLSYVEKRGDVYSSQSKPDQMKAYGSILNDPRDGVLAPITFGGYALTYRDLSSFSSNSDNSLNDTIEAFNGHLRDMVIRGQLSDGQVEEYRNKLKSLIRLSSVGTSFDAAAASLGDAGTSLNTLESKIFNDGSTTSTRLADVEDMLYAALNSSGDTQRALGDIIGLSPATLFDKSNTDHVRRLLTIVTSSTSDLPQISKTQNDLIRDLVKSIRDGVTVSLDPTELDKILQDAKVTLSKDKVQRTGGRKSFVSSNLSDLVRSVMLANADDFKLFLIFLAKFLKNQGSSIQEAVPAKVLSAASAMLSDNTPPGVKRFSDVHYIVSGFDIVENNIITTMAEMANNILLLTVKDIVVKEVVKNAGEASVWAADPTNTDYIPYPNYQYSGVDFHPFVKPELRKQRVVKEPNAESDIQRAALLINHMAEAIRPMYRGHLTVIGRNIKPYDRVVLLDTNKDMIGMFEVEHVQHSFTVDGGWITEIVPCALIHPIDAIGDVVSKFDTSMLDKFFIGLSVFDWLMDGLTVVGLISAFAGGGALAVGAQGAKQAGQTAGKKFISGLVQGATKGILRRVLATNATQFAEKAEKLAAQYAAKNVGKQITKDQIEKLTAQITSRLIRNRAANLAEKSTLVFMGSMAAGLEFAFGTKAAIYGIGLGASAAFRRGLGVYSNMATQMKMQSATLPIHTYVLTRFGRPLQAGLDMEITKFYTFSERLGISIENITRGAANFMEESFKIRKDDLTGTQSIVDILRDYK